jgi:hypothetical protein
MTESDDLATFPQFFEFLRRFAEKSPDLAFLLLTENLDEIRLFMIPLLRGIWKGPRKEDFRELMMEWIAEDLHLIAITKLFISNDNIDEEILKILLDKGTKNSDCSILISIVDVAVSNFSDGREDLVLTFLLPAVGALTQMHDVSWIHVLCYRVELNDIIQCLGKNGRSIILDGMLVADGIDYDGETILTPLARDNPGQIIEFFGRRLRYAEEMKSASSYDAIPYQFHSLQDTLSDFSDISVNIVRQWFDGNDTLFQYHGAKLLKIIFPDFAEPFGSNLVELVRAGERQDVEFVLSVLRSYEGQPFLLGVCREIILILPEDDDSFPMYRWSCETLV